MRCQVWSNQEPHVHTTITPENFPNSGLGNVDSVPDLRSNKYCRNPDGQPSLWCYTIDSKLRYEACADLYLPMKVKSEYRQCAKDLDAVLKTEY